MDLQWDAAGYYFCAFPDILQKEQEELAYRNCTLFKHKRIIVERLQEVATVCILDKTSDAHKPETYRVKKWDHTN